MTKNRLGFLLFCEQHKCESVRSLEWRCRLVRNKKDHLSFLHVFLALPVHTVRSIA